MRKSVDEIIDAIKSLKGLTRDYEVADALGVARATLSNAKRRDSRSLLNELVVFCERENLSLDFIRRDRPVSGEIAATPSSTSMIPPEQGDKYVVVPVLSYGGAAPGGGMPPPEEIGSVAIPKRVYGEGTIVIRVNGDSMEKLFMNGSCAVVDTKSREIISGCVYAFRVPWEGCILRECISDPAGLSLIPYNRSYPASSIKWDDFDPGKIIGKVTCSVVNVFG